MFVQQVFFRKIRKIIANEKMGALTQNKYAEFEEKWRNFMYIYDIR